MRTAPQIAALALGLLAFTTSAQAQQPRTSGSITAGGADCSVATRCVALQVGAAGGSAAIAASGFGTATITVEISVDATSVTTGTWTAQPETYNLATGATGSTFAATGYYVVPLKAGQWVRARASSYSSGTIAIAIGATAAAPAFTPNTTQPISAASLPLPTGAAQEHTTAASPSSARLSDGAAFYDATKTGQLPSALVSNRLDVNVGNTPTVTANAGTNLNTSALALDATVTGRLPAGASPADNESNTNTNLSRLGSFNFLFDGSTWDRWPGDSANGGKVQQGGTWTVQPGNTANTTAWLFAGGKTNNNAAPGATNLGVLPCLANTSAPSYSDGNQVLCSTDTSGGLRVHVTANDVAAGGTSSADGATYTAGSTTGTPVMAARDDTSPGTVAEDKVGIVRMSTNRNLFSTIRDAAGNERGANVTASNELLVNCSNCTGSGASITDRGTFTLGTTSLAPTGGIFDDTPPTDLTTGMAGVFRLTPKRALQINLRNQAGTEMGTSSNPLQVTGANGSFPISGNLTGNQATNVAQYGGTNVVSAGVSGLFAVGGSAASGASKSGNPVQIGGVFNTTQPTVTNGQAVEAQFTARGAAIVASGVDALTVGGTVTANIGTTNGLALDASVTGLQVAQGSTTSGQKGGLTLGAVTTAAPSYTTAQTSPISLTTTGLLRVDGSGVTQPVSGTVTTTPPSNASTNVAQFGGTNVSTGTGAGGAGIPRVTISNDSSLAANQSVNVAQFAGSNAVTGTGASGAGIPRVTVANDSTVTANAGTNLNTSALALESGGNLASVKTNTDPLVAAGAGGYVRQDSTATIAKETGGNLATVATQTTASASSLANIDTDTTDILNALRGTDGSRDSVLFMILRALLQQGTPKSAAAIKGSFGRVITSTGDALDVNVKYPLAALDPCDGVKKNAAISQTANTRVIVGGAGQVYVCSIFAVGADAENLSLVEGTGSTCGTGTAAVIGGTTAANGPNFAANGGWIAGNGRGAVAISGTPGTDLCLFQSGAGRVAGNLTYVIR